LLTRAGSRQDPAIQPRRRNRRGHPEGLAGKASFAKEITGAYHGDHSLLAAARDYRELTELPGLLPLTGRSWP
jgi:hypothetical protein